jgi:hypothetical protein
MGAPAPFIEDLPPRVVVIELFGGILPATAGLKLSGISAKTYFSEIANDPLDLASAHWPEAEPLGDMQFLDLSRFDKVVADHPNSLIWLTAGGLCKDSSRLNAEVQGAGGRFTALHEKVRVVIEHLGSIAASFCFTIECARMDDSDLKTFNAAFGGEPIEINNRGWAPLSRPRWWWIGGKVPHWPTGTEFGNSDGVSSLRPSSQAATAADCLLPGYTPCVKDTCFRGLTTRSKQPGPLRKPPGRVTASDSAQCRWKEDHWSQAPCHYEDSNMVQDARGLQRRLLPCEEELLMGYPTDYTSVLKKVDGQSPQEMAYRRHTLLANSWSLHVVMFLIQSVILPQGLSRAAGPKCLRGRRCGSLRLGKKELPIS